MAIDILGIQPSVISRDLKGKYVLLYGKPKSGKTTAAASFPKTLLCAFEKGYNAIAGIKAQDITKWSDYKMVLRQLEQDAAKEMYETIVIDTISIAYDLCEQYICAQHGVQKIGDIPYGAGYAACKKEFETSLRKITQMGYGLVLIAHSATRIEKNAEGSEIEIISPELPKRAAEVCNGLVDILGYIGTEYTNGEPQQYLYTRETPTLFAGSRFKYLAPKVKFGYDELVKAISDSIDEAERNGAKVVEKAEIKVQEKADYGALMVEAKELWTRLVTNEADPVKQQDTAKSILKKIEMIFGHPMKLSEITEDQVDLLELVVVEMRDM